MSEQIFIGREDALKWLNELFSSTPSFGVLYGRRRVGKTELVKKFSENKKHIYFLAGEKADKDNMQDLQKIMGNFLNDDVFSKSVFDSWEDLFNKFTEKIKERTVITIDEFPFLIEHNKSIPSIFQKIWDENLKHKKVMLVLLGSSIRMMETQVLGYQSPLYGRRTGQWKLMPLKFKLLKKFYSNSDFEEIVKFFSFTDGIPTYLQNTDPSKSFEWNIKNKIFRKGAYLYEEAEFLLRQELREPANYFQILQAVAEGNTKYGEICNRTGFEKSLVSQYLKNLIDLHIIEPEVPVTQNKESRNKLYFLSDNYYKFWFKFVYSNKSLIEEDKQEDLMIKIKESLVKHFSFVFEKICQELLWEIRPIKFSKIGRWWQKDKEIDIVAIDESSKEILFAECKWQENVNAEKIFEELKEKAKFVDWNKGKRKEHYLLFAKSFKEKLENCYDLSDLDKITRK